MAGWSPAPLTRTVSPNPELWPSLAPAEGSDPLKVTINAGLNFRQLNSIPTSPDTTYAELWKAIAPFVLEWNVRGVTIDGEEEILPAPAEAGWEIFDSVRGTVAAWLSWEIRIGIFGDPDSGKADETPSELTQNGQKENDSVSLITENPQRSQKTTTSSGGSTRSRRPSKNGSTPQPLTSPQSSTSRQRSSRAKTG